MPADPKRQKEQAFDRFLIVNADDFGLTPGINRGIIEAHERGIVTSASLMVRHPAATEAALYARANPKLSVGLHFELGEWRCIRGEWTLTYQWADSSRADAVKAEFKAQLATFERLIGRLPSHFDSHQHAHQGEPARSILRAAGKAFHVPLRDANSKITYIGKFYGQSDTGQSLPAEISAHRLCELIRDLPGGWTELGCHPGYAGRLDSVYREEREQELRALCSRAPRNQLESGKIRLCSFHDFEQAESRSF